MKQPRTAQVYASKTEYWAEIEKMRTTDTGRNQLPSWAFDFISIHTEAISPKDVKRPGYTFCSPMVLISHDMGRPEWEQDRYATKRYAIAAARKLAKMHSKEAKTPIHVVICS